MDYLSLRLEVVAIGPLKTDMIAEMESIMLKMKLFI